MARNALFTRLPEVWRILDQVENVVDGKGVLERYLDIWDNSFDLSLTSAKSVLDTRDINDTPDKYLRLLGDLLGHRWRDYRSYQWNRQRIRELISRYSYKGTALAILDLAYEHGASHAEIIDNASLVDVWNVQNGMFFDADFFHPGVFQLFLSDDVDFEHFIEDFEELQQAGSKWYFTFIPSESIATAEFLAGGEPKLTPHLAISDDGQWWWNYVPQPPVQPETLLTDVHAVALAYLTMGSLTLTYDEDLVEWGDGILPAELNHKQPLVDIDIPN